MWHKNIASRFFGLVTKHACDRRTDRRTDGRTDGQNYDSQDRASIAASRGKNECIYFSNTYSVVQCLKIIYTGHIPLPKHHIQHIESIQSSSEKVSLQPCLLKIH